MRQIEDGNDRYFQADVANIQRNAPQGTTVHSGGLVTSDGTDLTLDVNGGNVGILGTQYSIPSTTTTLASADTYDRYDLVIVDNTGSVTNITGTSEKKTPQLNNDQVLLAIVLVPAGATAIANGDVLDARILSDNIPTTSPQTRTFYTQSSEPTSPSTNDIWFQTQ